MVRAMQLTQMVVINRPERINQIPASRSARQQIRQITRASALPEPDSVKGAISIGLQLFNEGNYDSAINAFERALDGSLPGSGLKRFRDKPKLISDGEKQSALYNIACCFAKMNNVQEGLVALAGCLEAGTLFWHKQNALLPQKQTP